MRYIFLLAIGIFVSAGCAEFRDRRDYAFGSGPLTLQLHCNAIGEDLRIPSGDLQNLKLKIVDVKDRRNNKDILGIIQWPNTVMSVPYTLTTPVPVPIGAYKYRAAGLILDENKGFHEVLVADIMNVLSNFFISPSDEKSSSSILEITILEAWVGQTNVAPYTATPLVARVIFRVEIIDNETQNILWGKTFSGEDVSKEMYPSRRKFEEALNKAHCAALNSFTEGVKSDDFKQAIQKK